MSYVLISIGIGMVTGFVLVVAVELAATLKNETEEVMGRVRSIFGLSPMVVYLIGFAVWPTRT